MNHQGDPSLVASCLRGDQAAWNSLVERYGRLVYSIPRRYHMSEADADDVFASTFALLYRNLSRLTDHARVSSWLITTAHRECWRIGKSQAGRRGTDPAVLDQAIVDVGEPDEPLSERLEQQQLVREALSELGGRCEQLLRVLYVGGGEHSYETIAEQLGMKIGSIGPTRARCLEKLERLLRERGFVPEVELNGPPPEATAAESRA